MILLNDKSRIRDKAKQINSTEKIKTLTLLFVCISVFLLLSNLRLIISIIPTYFNIPDVFSSKYFTLSLSCVTLLISVPLLARLKTLREVWFIFKIKSQSKLKFKTVRSAVEKSGFRKYLMLYIKLWLLNFLWTAILLVPSAILLMFCISEIQQATVTMQTASIMIFGNIVLAAIAIVAYACVRQRYALCYWIMIQRYDLSPKQIINESSRLMDKRCVDLFLFKLKFFAWILLAIVVFPTIAYSYPYYKESCAVYALDLLSTRKKCEDATITFECLR